MQVIKKRNSVEPLIISKGYGVVNYDGLVEDEVQRHQHSRVITIFSSWDTLQPEVINPFNFQLTKTCEERLSEQNEHINRYRYWYQYSGVAPISGLYICDMLDYQSVFFNSFMDLNLDSWYHNVWGLGKNLSTTSTFRVNHSISSDLTNYIQTGSVRDRACYFIKEGDNLTIGCEYIRTPDTKDNYIVENPWTEGKLRVKLECRY